MTKPTRHPGGPEVTPLLPGATSDPPKPGAQEGGPGDGNSLGLVPSCTSPRSVGLIHLMLPVRRGRVHPEPRSPRETQRCRKSRAGVSEDQARGGHQQSEGPGPGMGRSSKGPAQRPMGRASQGRAAPAGSLQNDP